MERLAKTYREERQAYIKWDYSQCRKVSRGIVRIGRFNLNPDRDWIHFVDGGIYENRQATKEDRSNISVSACKCLRHLPYGASLELYFGDLPEKDREAFRKAFPNAKEIVDD